MASITFEDNHLRHATGTSIHGPGKGHTRKPRLVIIHNPRTVQPQYHLIRGCTYVLTGAAPFLNKRANRNDGIRTQYLYYKRQEAKVVPRQNAEYDEQSTTTDQNLTTSTHPQHRTDRTQVLLWHGDGFVSGHVHAALQYWKETILTTQPQRDEVLGYIRGVRLSECVGPESTGSFEGFQFIRQTRRS